MVRRHSAASSEVHLVDDIGVPELLGDYVPVLVLLLKSGLLFSMFLPDPSQLGGARFSPDLHLVFDLLLKDQLVHLDLFLGQSWVQAGWI